MIVTHVRDKLAAHLSYPVTLAELRRLLLPASETCDINVWFWSPKPPRRNSSHDRYQVLDARYSADSPRELFVGPVPRKMRSLVRSAMVPVGTDRVCGWLMARRTPLWYSSHHRFVIYFIPASDELAFTEYPMA
jgi:hypothetical protein